MTAPRIAAGDEVLVYGRIVTVISVTTGMNQKVNVIGPNGEATQLWRNEVELIRLISKNEYEVVR